MIMVYILLLIVKKQGVYIMEDLKMKLLLKHLQNHLILQVENYLIQYFVHYYHQVKHQHFHIQLMIIFLI